MASAAASEMLHGIERAAGCAMDLLFVAVTIAFFAVSIAYVRGCDRL